jgi:RNA polymerase sigma-70 factor, ECF subfamily
VFRAPTAALSRQATPCVSKTLAHAWRRPSLSTYHPTVENPDVPDAALVERFRAGDRDAFEVLVKRHQSAVRQLVTRYVKNDADAKDVSQGVFVRALDKLQTFEQRSSFRTWLFRIAINAAIDHVRGGPPASLESLEDVAVFTHSLQTSRLVAAEVWRKVGARLDQLGPKQRLVLELRVFHDLPFAEIAALADCTVESARVNFQHAVRHLRDLLGPMK